MHNDARAFSAQIVDSEDNEAPPHPLTVDGWMPMDRAEHATVANWQIADITRAVSAIKTLGRLLHNSLGEPGASGAQPLGRGFELDLADAIVCLGDYAYGRTEDMRLTDSNFLQYARENGEHENG